MKLFSNLFALLALLLAGPQCIAATPPAVPAEFRDLYTALEQRIDAFDKTLSAQWDGKTHPVNFSAELCTANGNRGKALLIPRTFLGCHMELDRLQALGVKAVKVAIPFPLLAPAYFQFQGQPDDSQGYVDFFKRVVQDARARGIKVIVGNGPIFPGAYSAGSGIDAVKYFASLGDEAYVEARAQQARRIAREIAPAYIDLGCEPDVEFRLTKKAVYRTPTGFASTIRRTVDGIGATSVTLTAGVGTWLGRGGEFVEELCKIPALPVIDLHIYPVNGNYLGQALALANQARAHGKKVAVSEAWLNKIRDAELGTLDAASDPTAFARDAYSFWAPLDQKFLAVLVKFAHQSQLEFCSAYWDKYFFAYADYAALHASARQPTAAQVLQISTQLAARGIVNNELTATGRAYGRYITGNLH